MSVEQLKTLEYQPDYMLERFLYLDKIRNVAEQWKCSLTNAQEFVANVELGNNEHLLRKLDTTLVVAKTESIASEDNNRKDTQEQMDSGIGICSLGKESENIHVSQKDSAISYKSCTLQETFGTRDGDMLIPRKERSASLSSTVLSEE
eukprot:m.332804 g.332804  ORF g.332804 m.332804 type:complete len:148 (+) comp17009_c0_seq1:127-570(+)